MVKFESHQSHNLIDLVLLQSYISVVLACNITMLLGKHKHPFGCLANQWQGGEVSSKALLVLYLIPSQIFTMFTWIWNHCPKGKNQSSGWLVTNVLFTMYIIPDISTMVEVKFRCASLKRGCFKKLSLSCSMLSLILMPMIKAECSWSSKSVSICVIIDFNWDSIKIRKRNLMSDLTD